MKSFSRIALVLWCVLLLCYGCQSLIENPEAEMNNISIIQSNDALGGILNYQGKVFYSGGVDASQILTTTKTRSESDYVLTRSFNIQVASAGDYYLNTHIMAAIENEGNSYQNIQVWVNESVAGELDILTDAWSFVSLKNDRTIHLKAGLNKITFSSRPPYFPEIDVIQVDTNKEALLKEDSLYQDYISQLSQQKNTSTTKLSQDEIDSFAKAYANPATKSAYDDSYSWQVTPRTLDNPDGNYQHMVCVPITYTYHRKLSLSQGTYTFKTGPIDGDDYYTVDPVMYLYKIDDPHNYSYYNDDYSGSGFHSQITATLPTGEYYLVIRAYSSYYASTATGRQGLINVYQNGTLLNTQTPVAGYSVDVDSPNTGLINYFTAYSTGIPVFFLEEKSSHLIKFCGECYFYISPMEQMWFNDARMRLTKNSSTARYKVLISCVGAFGAYYGNCDVYGSCQQVKSGDSIANAFPNLMVNDGIYSSAANTNTYNCASWAGGVTYGWTWGGIYSSQSSGSLVGPYYGLPTVWSSWDAFFANNPQRYVGATVYTRDDANASNGEVAVWSTNGSISGVTHFSCRGTANEHPHGYAWESKPGGLRRIFHPRDALRGNGYGNIFAYYRDASKSPDGINRGVSSTNLSMEESIERGLTVIENVELTKEEESLFLTYTAKYVRNDYESKIQELYNQWRKRIQSDEYSFLSNPYTLLSIPEGDEMITFCKLHKEESLSFFLNLFFTDKVIDSAKEVSYYMFCLVFSDYANIIEEIKDTWRESPYDSRGAYIAPTAEMFAKRYAQKLIPVLFKQR